MAFNQQKEINFLTILVTSWLLVTPVTATTNIDCRGKAFHCVNSTHFKICVDFGGVSKTVDDFLLPCPQSTICRDSNYFECEYDITTARATITEQSYATNKSNQITTLAFWDFNVTTTRNDEQGINITRSSIRSLPQLAPVLPVTEKLERIAYTPANKLNEHIILDSEFIHNNATFNETRESENNFKSSTGKETTITYDNLSNNILAADINFKMFANTERVERITNSFKSIKPTISASTKYSERLFKSGVSEPLNSMQRYANEKNNTPTSQNIGSLSNIFTIPETLSNISKFTEITDSYTENMRQTMKTSDFDLPITSSANNIAHNSLVTNKNMFENGTERITSFALIKGLMTTTETNNKTLFSLTTLNKPLSNVENELRILKNFNLSLPVITQTFSTTNMDIDGENSSYVSHLPTSTDSNIEYVQYDPEFEEVNRSLMSTALNEFYTEAPKIASNNKIKITSLPVSDINNINGTLSAQLNETSMLPSKPYNDKITFMTTENTSFMNTEEDLTILQNISTSLSANMGLFKGGSTEIPSNNSNSTNLINSYIDITHQDTKWEDKNLPISSTSDVYDFYTEKDVFNENKQDVSIFEKRTSKNTIDMTTTSTLSEILISTLATNEKKEPSSIAVNISFNKIPNESTISKNNNVSVSVTPEYFTTENFDTDAPLDISKLTSITKSYTENSTQNIKERYEIFSNTPITNTHMYDLFTNITERTSNNMLKDLSFNKNGIDIVTLNTTNIDFTTSIINGSKIIVLNAVKENANDTVKKLSPHKNMNLSSTTIHNFRTKVQQITENNLMDTLSYNSTKPYVLNTEQNPKRDYTMDEHDSYNNTDSVTIQSTTINFLEYKVKESSNNSYDPSVTNAVNETMNNTIKKLSPHDDINLSSAMIHNYKIKDQQITENIVMDILLHNSTEPYVSNTERNPKRYYTMEEHDSYNNTESVTIQSRTINFLENEMEISSNFSHSSAITDGKDIVRVEQNKNNYDSLTQDSYNNLLFTKSPLQNRPIINFDNLSQKNENDSEFIKNIIGILSHTTPTIDYTQSTEYKISPHTWNILNNTVFDLLTRKYSLNNKYKAAILESQRNAKNPYLDNINRTELYRSEIEGSTSTVEVDTSLTSVTVVGQFTRSMGTTPKNIQQMIIQDFNIKPDVTDIDRGLKAAMINSTTSPKKPEILSRNHTNKNDSSDLDVLESLAIMDISKLFKTPSINLFSYSSNVPLADVENITDNLTKQSIKTDTGNIFTSSSNLPITTEKFSNKLIAENNLITTSNSSRSYAITPIISPAIKTSPFMYKSFKSDKNLLEPVISDLNASFYQSLKNNRTLRMEQAFATKVNIIPPIDVTTTKLVYAMSEINGTNLNSVYNRNVHFKTNISQSDIKVTELKNPSNELFMNSIQYAVNNDKVAIKTIANNLTLESYIGKTLPNIRSSKEPQSVTENYEVININKQINISETFRKNTNYTAIEFNNMNPKITDNNDRLNKLKYLETVNDREQNYRSNFNNEAKLPAETNGNLGNYSINMIVKCRDNNMKESCSKKGEDFTKLSQNDHNETNTFERSSQFAFNCDNRPRGKYSDKYDCNFFYLCLGKGEPIFGKCPNNTVFSEILKQCTKNLSHCERDNKFQCKSAGRYIDVLSNQFYYICVKKEHGYVRFKLQCQKGYHLSNSKIKCVLDTHNGSSSYEDSSNIEKNRKTVATTPREDINSKNRKKIFECLEEGKFTYPDHCRKFYECKRAKSEFRRKIKKCDSNEVFDDDKKKCVNDDSYECT